MHAAGESAAGGPPLPEGTFAIVLAAQDAAHLESISKALALNALGHVLVREPDAPFDGAATAIGLVPAPRDRVRKLLQALPLYR
ncbi:MAG: hypothetical protein IT381_28225 [Deltaproteobacteria bacterium]|nr:hypothetical protein [Deltaproteobacteria bacterium]